MKIKVDMARCTGHAQCAAQAPDLYILDDYGNCAADGVVVPEDQKDVARAGATACPEQAIELVDDE